MDCENLKKQFKLRKGFFNQKYKSIRLRNCEITIDNLLSTKDHPDQYQLSVCTPYNEKIDELKHKNGYGAGEVKRYWMFTSEEEVYNFILRTKVI